MSKGLPYMLERAGLDVQQGKNSQKSQKPLDLLEPMKIKSA